MTPKHTSLTRLPFGCQGFGPYRNIRGSFPVWTIWRAADKTGFLARQAIAPAVNLSYFSGN